MWGDDFWKKLSEGHTTSTVPNAVDTLMSGKAHGSDFESVRHLTDKGRQGGALELPVQAGQKVIFAGTMGAVMSMENPPKPGATGEVVNVKSANGDITSHNGKVFVKWDDDVFRPVYADFLRDSPGTHKKAMRTSQVDPTDRFGRIASAVCSIRVASLGDLTSFLKVSNEGSTLIHRSTKDLWSFEKDADGGFIVNRLFDDSGSPLKG